MMIDPSLPAVKREKPAAFAHLPAGRQRLVPMLALSLLCFMAVSDRADTVEMQNGDRYTGKILSVDTNTVVIQNDVLGTVRLPRGKMLSLIVSSDGRTNAVVAPTTIPGQSPAITNPVVDLSAALRQLGGNTNFIHQVQTQILGAAGPEANKKFNDLVAGMMTGKITVNDIRTEASSAVKQLKELKRDLGDGAGDELDGYLAILESFLRETKPESKGATNNAAAPSAKPSPESKR